MKAMILNFSGNVGKSTIARYLLAPRLEDCELVSVESINANDHDIENLRGSTLGKIIDEIVMIHDNVILDVGSSNAETVVSLLGKYSGAHEEFDLFIIPVISKPKVIIDTIATAAALRGMGVPASKIIIVLNQVDVETDIKIEFQRIAKQDGIQLSYDSDMVIPTHDFFTRIAGTGFDFLEVLNDETDYKKLIKETEKDDPTLKDYVLRLALKRLATSLNADFDLLFNKLQSKVAEND